MTTKALLASCLVLLAFVFTPFAHAAKKDYILGPGDIVRITVYDHQDMTTEARISERNAITFPLIGEVKIGGGSSGAAETAIAKQLAQGGFVKQAQVNVVISQFHSQQISVLGQVNKPGKYAIETASNVADLLAIAGGVNQIGADNAVLVRQSDSGTVKKEIDLIALLQSGDISQNMEVMNDDVIFVPRAQQFYIYGEVQRPGSFRLERNMTVMQALSVGGGLTQRGSEKGVTIKRRDAKGEVQTLPAPGLTQLLQADDVIYVKESLF
jgi:polysaccharide export outer membrane protein